MSRYIDAENILYSSVMIEEDNGNYRKMWIATKEDIDAIPTAAVRENVKGEWIFDGQRHRGGLKWCHCSVCGHAENADYAIVQGVKFCPNCGADMRGEVND